MIRTMSARGWHHRRPRLLIAALVLLGMGGCTRGTPVTAPVSVALDVPPAPARVISTPPEPVAPTEATTVERPAPASRPSRTGRSTSTRPDAARPAEPACPEAAPEVVPPTPTEPAPNTGPLLRTPQTADESNAERRTTEVLDRANGLLDRVKPETLGPQARQQHETARRFVDQARQAIVDRNFVLASYLADKAETLAKGLSR